MAELSRFHFINYKTDLCKQLRQCFLTNTPATVLQPFLRDHPGEPVPEENFWNLMCNGRLTEADTRTIRLGATPSGLTSAHLHHHSILDKLHVLDAILLRHVDIGVFLQETGLRAQYGFFLFTSN